MTLRAHLSSLPQLEFGACPGSCTFKGPTPPSPGWALPHWATGMLCIALFPPEFLRES